VAARSRGRCQFIKQKQRQREKVSELIERARSIGRQKLSFSQQHPEADNGKDRDETVEDLHKEAWEESSRTLRCQRSTEFHSVTFGKGLARQTLCSANVFKKTNYPPA
jgi:hypothetical protein